MAGYKQSSHRAKIGWQDYQVKKSWRNLVSVFITITLVFAVINGLLKSFSIKTKIADSKWNGKDPLVLAIKSANASVFVYQPETKQVIIFTNSPISSISKNVDSDALNFSAAISRTFGVKIDNYIYLKDKSNVDEILSRNLFEDFKSFATPFELATVGWGADIEKTNITRIDALRLWWQLKDISVNKLKLADLGDKNQLSDSGEAKVLGADVLSINREIAKYVQNFSIIADDVKVQIKNSSGKLEAANLAYSFVASYGVKVVDVENSRDISASTTILSGGNSYTASYLAKTFNCDIKDALEEQNSNQIILILGQDFAKEYFK